MRKRVLVNPNCYVLFLNVLSLTLLLEVQCYDDMCFQNVVKGSVRTRGHMFLRYHLSIFLVNRRVVKQVHLLSFVKIIGLGS